MNHHHKIFIVTLLTNSAIALGDIAVGFLFLYKTFFTEHIPLLQLLFSHIPSQDGIGAFYFFSHGAIKLFLLWALFSKKMWGYPLAIAFLAGFSAYQAFTLTIHFSWFVTGLLIFNLFVSWAIWKEYTINMQSLREDSVDQ